ncbi:MAG: dihydrodipicolinate synthase family protein, partial [Clostridiales bacterium]|nr:dihydrodipicolinate synthase family protein [Clostridiales bacterium]
MEQIRQGVYPTMITPYAPNGEIDYALVERLVDWYAEKGCRGVFAVCQSSEMAFLSLRERVRLAQTVTTAASGRLDVVASGHISDSPEAQAEEVCAVAETGVRAVVLVTNRLD